MRTWKKEKRKTENPVPCFDLDSRCYSLSPAWKKASPPYEEAGLPSCLLPPHSLWSVWREEETINTQHQSAFPSQLPFTRCSGYENPHFMLLPREPAPASAGSICTSRRWRLQPTQNSLIYFFEKWEWGRERVWVSESASWVKRID